MKIAIHHRDHSFSVEWIKYCDTLGIDYKIVDCYRSDIIEQLKDCDALMWHFHHKGPKDVKFAKQLLFAVQAAGKMVYPDFNTAWHFDDKVGQKYLLEAIGAPLVPSYVFYSRAEALAWCNDALYPKVFKLRIGAGSQNVRLVKTKSEAKRIVKKAFGLGFRQNDPWVGLKERWRKLKMGKTGWLNVAKGLVRFVYPTRYSRTVAREKGYVYFQEFIPDCLFDLRVKIVGDKCWAFKRFVRKNDFRASGSGRFEFNKDFIPIEVIILAFDIARKANLQSVAFDFVVTPDNRPLILELSYGFGYAEGQNYGYWDSKMNWYSETFNPFGWMVDLVMK